MDVNVPASNLLGYITAFVVIVLLFGGIRLLCRCPSKIEKEISPPPIGLPQQQTITIPQLVDLAAAAVAGVHFYLKDKMTKTNKTQVSPANQKQSFINYWVLTERLNPSNKDDPYHREKYR